MFIYENGNSLNLTLTGTQPVETPDVVIKGFEEGAAVIVGSNTYGVATGTDYEGKAQTLVYQKDGKLVITFRGIAGMNDPEVTIDEIGEGEYAVVVSGQEVTLKIADDKVEPVSVPEEETPAPMTGRSTKKSEPEVVEDPVEPVEPVEATEE